MYKRYRILTAVWVTALILAAAALVLLSRGEAAVPTGGSPPAGYLALTFDDGPWPGTTRELLDGLRERGVHATFFLIGRQAADRPDLVERMAAEGHQIGLHTWDHVALRGLDRASIDRQLSQSREALQALTGAEEFMLRPPYGYVDDTVRDCAGGPVICWSVDPEDWRDEDVGRIMEAVLSKAGDGDIILMHDIFHGSVTAALGCVDELQRRGYVLVTVEELFTLRGVTPEDGEVYRKVPPA